MTTRGRTLAAGLVAVAIGIALLIVAARSEGRRREPIGVAVQPRVPLPERPSLADLPVERWTPRLIEFHRAGAFEALAAELEGLREKRPAEFAQFRLGYLLARVLIEIEQLDRAERELVPFLRGPFAPLARHHLIRIAVGRGDEAEAARLRRTQIREEPDSIRREEEIEAQLESLQENAPAELIRFAAELRPSAETALRRELDARSAEALLELGREGEAVTLALRILRGGTADDPAERALRVADRPTVVDALPGEDLALLGEAAREHRHFERAIELLSLARDRLPAREADLLFAIGRSWFGSEQFAEAEAAYLAGAAATSDRDQEATFYFHAARAAQLTGEDDRAIRHMTRAIAVPGRFDATSAAQTQRMRTKAKMGDLEGATSDLRQLERLFPRGSGRVEAAVQLATYLLAAGRRDDALRELEGIPPGLTDAWWRAEIDYWRARAHEPDDAERAVSLYLDVMRADVPTHFAYFARERTRLPHLQAAAAARLREARTAADAAVASGAWSDARGPATAALLLSSEEAARERLRRVYRNLDAYREVLELEPHPLPTFPIEVGGEELPRADLLMAMGLFDEAQPEIEDRWGLRPMRDALTRAHALNLAAASRDSIYAIEVMMRSVPEDYVPELLPLRVRELLYPRYFSELIREEAERHGADPSLVLSIMREESRFDPRAKSAAAARGLLQFIITTARDIATALGIRDLESRDLYDPAIIIQLGARYIADLLDEFGGDRYPAVAAYNAGPFQSRLWTRLAPAEGADYFLTSVNFSETKDYVRKVVNSYERYGEIYEGRGVVGGVRAEP